MAEDRLDERADLEAAREVGVLERPQRTARDRRTDEVAPELRDHERGMERVLDAQPARVTPVPTAAVTEDLLDAGVVEVRIEPKIRGPGIVPAIREARQCTSLLLDVVLRVRPA